jgi:MFS family permease
MPQIISNMGYQSTNAQLLSAPPYLAGAVAAVVSSLWADRRSHRMPPIVFFQSLVLISMAVLFVYSPRIQDNIPLCYTMVVISCIGMYPIIPANQVSPSSTLPHALRNPQLTLRLRPGPSTTSQVPKSASAASPSW